MADSIKEVIKRSELFRDLSDAQMEVLEYLAVQQSFHAGQRIIVEGDPLPNFYIVVKGKVVLEMEMRIGARTKRQVVVDIVGENGLLGWSEFLDLPASMSATAVEDTQLLVFHGDFVRRLCSIETELGYKIMQEILKLASRRFLQTRRTLAHVLAVTSHDLRAPLATAQSTLDTMIDGFVGEISGKQKALLTGTRQRITDLLKMIDNILDISCLETKGTDFEKVDLYGVVVNSIGDVEGLARQKEIVIKNRVSKELSSVPGMPKRLQRALTNLLSNAVKFTPPGGTVTVASKKAADKIRIDVADTGIGIPAEELSKIFDDFYRGKMVEEEGAGLGLAIVRKIVAAHGGEIWVTSPDQDTGKGTRFSFTLPARREEVRFRGEAEMPDRQASLKRKPTQEQPA